MLEFDGNLGNRTKSQKGNLVLYASSIAFINSLVNPIIYAFKITSVRQRFRAVFCRKKGNAGDFEQSRTDAAGNRQSRSRTQVTTITNTVISEINSD